MGGNVETPTAASGFIPARVGGSRPDSVKGKKPSSRQMDLFSYQETESVFHRHVTLRPRKLVTKFTTPTQRWGVGPQILRAKGNIGEILVGEMESCVETVTGSSEPGLGASLSSELSHGPHKPQGRRRHWCGQVTRPLISAGPVVREVQGAMSLPHRTQGVWWLE